MSIVTMKPNQIPENNPYRAPGSSDALETKGVDQANLVKGLKRTGFALHLMSYSQLAFLVQCLVGQILIMVGIPEPATIVFASSSIWLLPMLAGYIMCAGVPRATKGRGAMMASLTFAGVAFAIVGVSIALSLSSLSAYFVALSVGPPLLLVFQFMSGIAFTTFLKKVAHYSRRKDLVSRSAVMINIQIAAIVIVCCVTFFHLSLESLMGVWVFVSLFGALTTLGLTAIGLVLAIIQFQLGSRLRSISPEDDELFQVNA